MNGVGERYGKFVAVWPATLGIAKQIPTSSAVVHGMFGLGNDR